MRTRLIAIALVPIIGLLSLAGFAVSDRLSQARRASTVARHVSRMSDYLHARIALESERVPTQALLLMRQYSIPTSFGTSMLGFDPRKRLAVVRPQTTSRIASLDDLSLQRLLLDIRRVSEVDHDSVRAIDLFTRLDGELSRRSEVELDRTSGVTAERELAHAVTTLLATQRLADALGAQTSILFDLGSGTVESARRRYALAVSIATADESLPVVRRHAKREVAAAMRRLTDDPSFELGKQYANEALEGPVEVFGPRTRNVVALTSIAKQFKDLKRRGELGRELLSVAAADAREIAVQLSDDARRALAMTIVAAVLLSLCSIGLALASARSISAPLAELAQRARRIAGGEIDGGRARVRGPNEIAGVTDTINELVDNIAILGQQASALAAGDLGAEVLAEPMPGAIGKSIRETVQRLRATMRNREELQALLAHQATHDDLTGMPNRHSLSAALSAALARGQRDGRATGVVFIDLDGFKRANDLHGHQFGDLVLRECAARIEAACRAGDLPARLGGDEFVVIVEHTTVLDMTEMAHRFIAVLSEPMELDGKAAALGASAGIALDHDLTATNTTMIRDADMAVYRAKAMGRGRVEVFDDALRREALERAELEAAIGPALDAGEFRLVYQPIVTLCRPDHADPAAQRAQTHSVEALLRWNRRGHGEVSPAHFIPLIESSPRFLALGRWVLCDATQRLARWQRAGADPELTMSVNVSPHQLQSPTFVADVAEALRTAGIEGRQLVVEVTETSLPQDPEAVADHLIALRALGVRVAIDDFGTGYTSIGHLGELPVDILKIDRSYVQATDDARHRTIVEMMVGVSATLGLVTVAEGVETCEQAALLARLGCHAQQGWYHHRPMEPDALEALLVTESLERHLRLSV